MTATDEEAREFARAFRRFLDWLPGGEDDGAANPVVLLIRGHLTEAALEHSVVSRTLQPVDHVNLQAALDTWSVEPGRSVTVQGMAKPGGWQSVDLNQLIHGVHLPPLRPSSPDLVDLPSGPGRTTACLRSALLLVEDGRGRYVVHVRGPEGRHGEPDLLVEVAGLPLADAKAVLADLDRLRSLHNVFRGQVVELVPSEFGFSVTFPVLPPTARDDVVLPEAVLRRIERHTLDVARRRDALLAAGRHLKRGVLMYGPPGTGKTHTTRYVVQHLTGSTVLLLSGSSLHLIGALAGMARELQPSVVVLEDVDLVAEERTHHHGGGHVLFDLLDAMDGADEDADLLFLLTTNRADLLEPALAARPGRVDVAVEIGLPDDDGRRRLLDLYGRGLPLALSEEDVAVVVRRTAGVTAAFVKELMRRAALEAIDESGRLERVGPTHVGRALDDLMDSSQAVTRTLLGAVGSDAGRRSEHDEVQ